MNLIQETKKAILACMNDFEAKQVMLKSMKDVHHPNLFSLVVDDKDGNLIDKKTEELVLELVNALIEKINR